MYFNIGGTKTIKQHDVIGIFDLDTSTVSKFTRKFLEKAEKIKKTEYVDLNELPKSFVLTKDSVIISPLNTATLAKRRI